MLTVGFRPMLPTTAPRYPSLVLSGMDAIESAAHNGLEYGGRGQIPIRTRAGESETVGFTPVRAA